MSGRGAGPLCAGVAGGSGSRTHPRFSLAARGPAHDLPAGPADRVRDAPGTFLHGGFAAVPRCEPAGFQDKIKGLRKTDVTNGGIRGLVVVRI